MQGAGQCAAGSWRTADGWQALGWHGIRSARASMHRRLRSGTYSSFGPLDVELCTARSGVTRKAELRSALRRFNAGGGSSAGLSGGHALPATGN